MKYDIYHDNPYRLRNAGSRKQPRRQAQVDSTVLVDVDGLIADLEERGLGWSLDHTGNLVEARVWDWPNVIGRYRPVAIEPLSSMLSKAMYDIDWTKYPKKTSAAKVSRRADNQEVKK